MASELVRFRRVLHVREVEREVTQSELAVKLLEEETIKERIDSMREKRDSALRDFCADTNRVVSPQELWFERQNLDVMEQSLDVGKQELEHCRAEIEETKTMLLEKHRNVQLMEGYVDKLKVRNDKKILLEEQNNLDDITAMRYLRNMRSEAEL